MKKGWKKFKRKIFDNRKNPIKEQYKELKVNQVASAVAGFILHTQSIYSYREIQHP